MKNATRHTGVLQVVERCRKLSRNGNPRYKLRLDSWTCWTRPDSALAYEVPGLNGQQVTAIIHTWHGKPTIADVTPINK